MSAEVSAIPSASESVAVRHATIHPRRRRDPGPIVTAKQLQWWGTLLREQGLATTLPNYPDLIAKA